MPLTQKGKKIMSSMKSQYGPDAKKVFYESKNAGTIKGVDLKHQTEAMKKKMKKK